MMAGRAMVQGLRVDVPVRREDGTSGTDRLVVNLVLDAAVAYRPGPAQGLDLSGLVAWVSGWAERTRPVPLGTLLADLIDRCFEDLRVHTVDAEVWDHGAPEGPATPIIGVGLRLDRTVHALQRDGVAPMPGS